MSGVEVVDDFGPPRKRRFVNPTVKMCNFIHILSKMAECSYFQILKDFVFGTSFT